MLWMRISRAFFVAAAVGFGASAPSGAVAIYNYSGMPFSSDTNPYTNAMSVTGFFELAAPLLPNLVDASPGVLDWELNAEASDPVLRIDTDGSGATTAWVSAAGNPLPGAIGEGWVFISTGSGFPPVVIEAASSSNARP